ncbi:MAG TPA: class I SAM-dependent methyltransferase [Candidatus Thiothrix moscowensis]|uniref:class I SAM-dependent methyltransferase n=1 Tax=unclassified Thiothrix TaxID=2636184 RepID=UPI001A1DD1CF|nr:MULTISPECIES: class I SAM-dependent methyltransferase [unclassified Thiothrix]MBJ6609606.1 class I SAM-dependent methyltransferase [Candidatus Thiothrix moscowensis]HRJ51606.1 class I SAM-dependent methyltransferase [Candidatus Thiothrix moscowensis]HRJ91921.1 class I SAM-dependent methyltransferase [Candidatus Thiothrix moscowensis]
MDAAQQMDRQYRYQRYVYDWSRKYYLLGRDTLLQEMPVEAGDTILEIGCGTARNLSKMAYRFPSARLFGVDASSMMLDTARAKLQGTLYENKITLRQGLAGQISYRDFGLEKPFDHIVFSYVLSMIPGWQKALEQTLPILKPGGCLHVVDFSDQTSMPGWFRKPLLTWLGWFHVHPDPAVPAFLQQLATRHDDQLRMRQLPGRYALLAHYQKKGNSNDHQPDIPHLAKYLDF